MHPDGHYRVAIGRWNLDTSNNEPPTLDEIQTELRRLLAFDAELTDATWLSRYRSQHRLAGSYRAGRVFHAGDSAHVWVPVMGQGMNTAMQDAFNLAWKLGAVVSGRADEGLLETYEAERRPVAAGTIASTDRMYRIMTQRSAASRSVLGRILPVLLSAGPVQKKAVAASSEILITYHSSALVLDVAGSRGLPAGRQAPDAVVGAVRAKTSVRLFDLFRRGWTVIGFSGETANPDTVQDLDRSLVEIQRRYDGRLRSYLITAGNRPPPVLGVSTTLLLDTTRRAHVVYGADRVRLLAVRPDGYIGFRGDAATTGQLVDYLETHLLPPPESTSIGRPEPSDPGADLYKLVQR